MTNTRLIGVMLAVGLTASTALADEGLVIGADPAGIGIVDDEIVVTTENGVVLRLDDVGDVVARTALGGGIADLAVDPRNGHSVVLLDDAVIMLDPALTKVWRAPLDAAGGGQVAIGELGTIAVVTGERLRTFTTDGVPVAAVTIPFADTTGVAVLDAQDLVIVSGTRHRHACGRRNDDAALVAFDGAGTLQWDAYEAAAGLRGCATVLADTRMVDVTRGEDGQLYALGETEGAAHSRLFDSADAAQSLVAFDASSAAPTIATARFAYYARFAPSGIPLRGQYFGFADEFSTVRPDAIAADAEGNVHVTGASTHTLDGEAFGGVIGFYQVLAADLGTRRIWQEIAIDDLEGEPVRLVVHAGRALATVPAVHDDTAGSTILVLPTEPAAGKPGRRPDRDDVGTFGYESGVSGADPTCYCDARRRSPTTAWLVVIVLVRPRRRR